MNEYRYKQSASVSSSVLRRIYEALDDEDKPFYAIIRKLPKEARKNKKTHLVIIESNESEYFKELLNSNEKLM